MFRTIEYKFASQNINTSEPNWIALPQAEGMHVNDSFTETKTLDGKKG